MKKATAVIGAAFGDEGKGLMTDYFASQRSDSLVIRYNGGCQAGHTVVTPSGVRHVFGHFGAGTLAGAYTFLSKYFVINTHGWKFERDILEAKGVNCKLMYDPRCLVSTPWDMQINQALERKRGNTRHGSCGWGINETVVRNLHRRMIIADVNREHLEYIRDVYVPSRLATLELSPDDIKEVNIDEFIDSVYRFQEQNLDVLPYVMRDYPQIIFEGAQGLLLDEKHRFFPHVTRSSTGLKNVLALCEDMEIPLVNVVYVMRSYMTRHGNGPFPTEDPNLRFDDSTNMPNKWQGNLRFGKLDIDLICEAISKDLMEGHRSSTIKTEVSLAVTHLDQLNMTETELAQYTYRASGPTRNDIWCEAPGKV